MRKEIVLMSRSRHFVTLAVTIFGVATAVLLASSSANTSTALADGRLESTRANTAAASNNATNADEQLTTVRCQPVEVYASTRLVRVKCAAAVQGIIYFGFDAKDPPNARNFLGLMEDALAQKKPLTIDFFMSDTSGDSLGCKKENCRTIEGIALSQ